MIMSQWMPIVTVVSVVCAVVSVGIAIRSYLDTRKRASAEALWQMLKSWGAQDMREAKRTVLTVQEKLSL